MKTAILKWMILPSVLLAGCGNGTTGGNDLDGTWETPCVALPMQQLYAKTRLVYSSLSLTGTFSDYADAACTKGMGVSTWTGTATVGGPAAAAAATQLDLTFDTYKYEPLSDQAAAVNNMYKYCGISDWTAKVEKDVLDHPCNGFAIPTAGKSLDIYKVEGSSLKFGKGAKISAAPAESDRPTVLDDTRAFNRVGQ